MEASNTRNDLEERRSSVQQSAFKTPPPKKDLKLETLR